MVASRPEDEALEFNLARGTGVFDEHEKAVIEICSNDSSDKEIEQCVVDYLSFEDEPTLQASSGDDEDALEEEEKDDDSDPLDNLRNMWAEDLPPTPVPQPSEPLSSEKEEEKIKPWSSRSSPSGTFVRAESIGVIALP